MKTLFYTYEEGREGQPHETFEDALHYGMRYNAINLIEVLHRDDMTVEFAWDMTSRLTIAKEFAISLADTMKAARDRAKLEGLQI